MVWAMGVGVVCAQQIEVSDGIYYLDNKVYTGKYSEYNADREMVRYSIRNGKLNGRVFLFDSSGNLKERRSYRAGRKQGVWYSWNDQGQKLARAAYRSDTKHGRWLIWDEHGKLRYTMRYRMGVKTGTWRMWNETGDISMEKKHPKTND